MKIKTFNYLWKIVVFPFALVKIAVKKIVNAIRKIGGLMSGEFFTTYFVPAIIVFVFIIVIVFMVREINRLDCSGSKKSTVAQSTVEVDLIRNFQIFGKDYDESYICIWNEEDNWREFYISLNAKRESNGESIEIEKEFSNGVDLNNYLKK